MMTSIIDLILIVLLLTASFFDVTKKKIPNFLTFPAMLIGLLLNIIMSNLNGLIFSVSGFFIGLAVFIIPYMFGLMGAGDVKLMAAIGTLMGWKFTVISTLFSAIAGIFVVFIYLIIKKKLFIHLKKYLAFIIKIILKFIYFSNTNKFGNKLKKIAYKNDLDKSDKLYIPYGLAIAIGTLVALSETFGGIL